MSDLQILSSGLKNHHGGERGLSSPGPWWTNLDQSLRWNCNSNTVFPLKVLFNSLQRSQNDKDYSRHLFLTKTHQRSTDQDWHSSKLLVSWRYPYYVSILKVEIAIWIRPKLVHFSKDWGGIVGVDGEATIPIHATYMYGVNVLSNWVNRNRNLLIFNRKVHVTWNWWDAHL